MATEILLPQWAMGLMEGTVAHWLKAAGDYVEAGEPLAEVEEAKVTGEVSAPAAGYLLKILAQEGETVPVRTPICLIGTKEELQVQAQPLQESSQTASPPTAASAAPSPALTKTPEAQPGGPKQITPIARKLAAEFKLDLSTIQGSGPGGRITEADVRQAYAMHGASKETEIPLAGMRGAVAQSMAESLHNSAQLTITMQADVTELLRQREALKGSEKSNTAESGGGAVNVTLTDVIIKATTLTLKKHPRLNGWVEKEKIRLPAEIHIGLAVALDEGLIVPVIRNADRKTLREIAVETKQLAQKARDKALAPDEAFGSTFTITNLGTYGVGFFTPIINLPEIAILGVGAVAESLIRQNDGLAWRKVLPLSLTIDHRAIDGAPAADFLRDVKDCLEQVDLQTL